MGCQLAHANVAGSGPAVLLGRPDPRHRESGLKVTRGHITKQGSPVLRWAVVEAIQRQPATSPIREVKDRIIARRGKQANNIAKAAAARHLFTAVFYAMRDGQARSLAKRTTAQDAAADGDL